MEKETKKLIDYDMKRILTRAQKEFGKIVRGTEEFYNPQLDYIEQAIYEIHEDIPINDYELQEAITIIIYDLKSYIDNIEYDYSDVVNDKSIKFAKELAKLFNPFVNDDIKITEEGKKDLKGLFTLPIICLVRIYDSIDFWRDRYGKDGYFKMLEEMVVPIKQVGEFPYALEEKYLMEESK